MEEHPSSGQAARGSDAEFCSVYPSEGHHMVSHLVPGAELVRWIEQCQFCGWIDGKALDEWAKRAIIESMTKRAQRIAMATESVPFSFHQPPSGELPLEEVLVQALAASAARGAELGANASDGKRETAIFKALLAEVRRFIRLGEEGASGTGVLAGRSKRSDGMEHATEDKPAGSGDLLGPDGGPIQAG